MGYLLFKYLLLRQIFKIFSSVSAVRVLYMLCDGGTFCATEKDTRLKKINLTSSFTPPSHPLPPLSRLSPTLGGEENTAVCVAGGLPVFVIRKKLG